MTFPPTKFRAQRRKVIAGFTQLIARAQAVGAPRTDFSPEDLPTLLMANAGVVASRARSPRLISYLIQPLAAPGGGELPPQYRDLGSPIRSPVSIRGGLGSLEVGLVSAGGLAEDAREGGDEGARVGPAAG